LENCSKNSGRNQAPINSTRSSKSGKDGSLLEIKQEELWVGSGCLSNEGETKGRSNS